MCGLIKKALMGITLAVVVAGAGRFVSASVFKPDELDKQAYLVDSGSGSTEKATAAAVPLTAEQFALLVEKSKPDEGAKTFKKCAACHSNDPSGAIKMGPPLFNVVGRKVGSVAGFAYSQGVASHGGNWDVESLNKWLADPKGYIAGTKMSFAGIKKDEERAAVISYLKTLK
jgi:cytochrome c